jgi:hypothetical protein
MPPKAAQISRPTATRPVSENAPLALNDHSGHGRASVLELFAANPLGRTAHRFEWDDRRTLPASITAQRALARRDSDMVFRDAMELDRLYRIRRSYDMGGRIHPSIAKRFPPCPSLHWDSLPQGELTSSGPRMIRPWSGIGTALAFQRSP